MSLMLSLLGLLLCPFLVIEISKFLTEAGVERSGIWPALDSRISGDDLSLGNAALIDEWVALIGLDPRGYGTHSLRRTKASLI